jgi:hypothetical protein
MAERQFPDSAEMIRFAVFAFALSFLALLGVIGLSN